MLCDDVPHVRAKFCLVSTVAKTDEPESSDEPCRTIRAERGRLANAEVLVGRDLEAEMEESAALRLVVISRTKRARSSRCGAAAGFLTKESEKYPLLASLGELESRTWVRAGRWFP